MKDLKLIGKIILGIFSIIKNCTIILGIFIYDWSTIIGMLVFISLYNAFVELVVAIRSIVTAIHWMITGFTSEWVIEDEDGNIIHWFPQIF